MYFESKSICEYNTRREEREIRNKEIEHEQVSIRISSQGNMSFRYFTKRPWCTPEETDGMCSVAG